MANYKVPQDVEAEDKLLGPFTFRQFIFLIIAAFFAIFGWFLIRINGWLALIPAPVVLVFGVLGVYRREDQPVETYLLAALNYFFKPHKRVWDSEGIIKNVRLVAVPKMAAPALKHLGGEERGQLQKLAHVMDTRGWSTKRPELNEPVSGQRIDASDRLVNPVATPTLEPLDIHSSDDLLDPVNFRDARKYQALAEKTTTQARAQAIKQMQAASAEVKDVVPQAARPVARVAQPPAPQTSQKTSPAEPRPPRPSPRAQQLAASELSVHHLARAAKKLEDGGDLAAGQEIDLPNAGESIA